MGLIPGAQNVIISGAGGFVGQKLSESLRAAGYNVFSLVRRPVKNEMEIQWSPKDRKLDHTLLPETPICINLAGENIASGRWTKKKKQRILSSRIDSTSTFVRAVLQLQSPAKHFLSASAVGIYGDRAESNLDESSDLGSGFLSDVCKDWESATSLLLQASVPVSMLRFGIILDQSGGALEKMLLPFKFGLGGKIGSGDQWMSWISLKDTISAIQFCIQESITGPVNIVAANPVRNSDFTKSLARSLNRPTILNMPEFAAKIAIGEFAEEALLSSTKVFPKKLIDNAFNFQYKKLDDFLKDNL